MISIITPVYNAEKTIKKTIESVINQSFENWEHILIDDCSSDNSIKVIEELAKNDSRIKLVRNKKNSGPAATRNNGLKEAKYSLIAMLDADDYYDVNKLEVFVDQIKSNPETPLFYSGYNRFNEENERVIKIDVPKEVSFKRLHYTNDILTSTVIVNKEVTGEFEFKNYYYDDFVCWLDMTKKFGNAKGINDALTYYRVHTNTVSSNKLKSSKKVYEVYRSFLKKDIVSTIFYMIFYTVYGIKKHFISKLKV